MDIYFQLIQCDFHLFAHLINLIAVLFHIRIKFFLALKGSLEAFSVEDIELFLLKEFFVDFDLIHDHGYILLYEYVFAPSVS